MQPPEPPARRPGEGTPGQPGGRTPESVGPKPKASVIRQPTVTVEPASVKAPPGATTEVVLTLTNNSDTVEAFTLELDDPSVGWIRFEPPTKNVWPGSREVFRIFITPPRSAGVRAGLKRYGISVRSSVIAGPATAASIEVEVLPFEAIETRLVPRTSTGWRRGRHRIEVRNQGSAPWLASIAATDPQEDLRFQVVPRVQVAPEETFNVRLDARPKAWNLIGKTVNRPFAVTLVDASGDQQRLDGFMDQQPLIPQRLILPLVAAAGLLVVAALFAAGVIPPKPPATPPPPTEQPSPSPSVQPSEDVTASPSTEVTESPSVEVSVPPESPPPGVAQWAADARAALLARDPPFDIGNFVGQTLTSANTAFQVQRFDAALLYKPTNSDVFVVIRDPILSTFVGITPDVANPSLGFPLDNRRNDRGQFAQVFTEGGITCGNVGCFVLARELFDTWFEVRETMGYPIEEPVAASDPSERLFVHTDNGWVVFEFGTGSTATCDNDKNFISGSDPNLCLF